MQRAREDAIFNEDKMQCKEVEREERAPLHEECVDVKVIRLRSSKSYHDE